jgi:tetratricopeptide (TPR) repeat protein
MRIKYLLLIVTLLATSINSNYLIGQDRIGIPGPLNFDGMNYFFYRSIKINNATYVQEYLPIKETSDSFHSMIICKLLITDWEVKEVAENKMKQMEDIKKTDSICNSRLFQSPDRTEYIVDYFLGEYKNKNILSGVEYYIYRYKRIKIRNDNDAVLAFVYMRHSNGINPEQFINEVNLLKNKYVDKMATAEIPNVKFELKELSYLKDPSSVKGYSEQLTKSQELAETAFLAGSSLNMNNQYTKAIEKFIEAIEIDSTGNCGTGMNGTAFGELGDCYFKIGDSSNAMIFFDKGIQINRYYPLSYLHKANMLAMQNRTDEAIKTLDDLISNISDEPIAYAQRGTLYDSTKADLALKDFNMFLNLVKEQNQEEPLKEMVEYIKKQRLEIENKHNKK